MKKNIFLTLTFTLLATASTLAHATVDYEDTIQIVTSDLHSGKYQVKNLPFIGCMGIPVYCTISMFTFDYKIPTGGCGQEFTQNHSYNELACANFIPEVIEVEKISQDGFKFLTEVVNRATIDLTGCEESIGRDIFNDYLTEKEKLKKVAELKAAIKKAFERNFPSAKALFIKYKGKDF
jgi:hypothetical protein